MTDDSRRWPQAGVVTVAIAVLGAAVIGTAYWVGATDGKPGADTAPPAPPHGGAGGISLVAYDSCDTALDGLRKAALETVTPWGLEGEPVGIAARAEDSRAPVPNAPDGGHSTTNNHESSADEPDAVKTDGKRIVSVLDGSLRVVDVASKALTATLAFPDGHASQLLLDGDKALVTVIPNGVGQPADGTPYGPSTRLVRVDLAGQPRITSSLTVDGAHIDARQVNSVARVVTRTGPRLEFAHPDDKRDADAALERNKEIIRNSRIADWLPRYTLERDGQRSEGELVGCADLSRPADYTGTSVLSTLTLDLKSELTPGDGVGVTADGDTVYGTGNSLYVADDRVSRVGILPAEARASTSPRRPDEPARTRVHQFDISKPGKPAYVASGVVDGSLLNQYALSEYKGHLRIATTSGDPVIGPQNNANSESAVTVLARKGDKLERVGSVGGLGKTERIQAARFTGDTAYLVTFRRTDPLYSLDLADPGNPRVTGELKITGYSAYLHPVADGRLLGVGQEAGEDGRTTGTQVSLFDTSAAPRRLAQVQLPGASSEVEFDPHAFLYWPERRLVAVPVSDGTGQDGVLVLRVDGDQLVQQATLKQPKRDGADSRVRRTVIAGGALWTVSSGGVQANALDGLGQVAWLPIG